MFSLTKNLVITTLVLISSHFAAYGSNNNNEVPGQTQASAFIQTGTATQTSDIKKVCEGVWAGEGFSALGKKIYFGMELIREDNAKKWRDYYCGQEVVRIGLQELFPDEGNEYPNINHLLKRDFCKGLSNVEIQLYSERLQRHANAFFAFGGHSSVPFLSRHDDFQMYVAYVSNKPVAGEYPFKKLPTGSTELCYPDFRLNKLEIYEDNILMAVKVFGRPGHYKLNLPKDVYENQGIFRAPASMLHDDPYNGISVPLLAFTAKVMKSYFSKKYLIVSPLKIMHDILCKKLEPNEMYIELCPYAPYFDGFADIPADLGVLENSESEAEYLKSALCISKEKADKSRIKSFGFGQVHLIKIDAIARYYTTKPPESSHDKK